MTPHQTLSKISAIMKIKDLAVDHPYYCSDSNYYSREPSQNYITFSGFYEDYKDADIDYNLCFRWDIKEQEDNPGLYYMEIFIIQQRKGIFTPITIDLVTDKDVPMILEYLKPHWDKMKTLWNPLAI